MGFLEPGITRSVAGLEGMTRLTELNIHVTLFIDKQENLHGLTRLQRLSLKYEPGLELHPPGTTYHPFVFPEAASITKLRFYFCGYPNQVGRRLCASACCL